MKNRLLVFSALVITGVIYATSAFSLPNPDIPLYLNSDADIEKRVEDLLQRMTLEEKIGQINIPCAYKKRIGWGMTSGELSLHGQMSLQDRRTQMDGSRKYARGTWDENIGPGGGFFTLADRLIYEGTRSQAEFFNELQKIAVEQTRLKIPLLQIEEGTHGLMCAGGTVFPEGLAIGSTWNMDLVREIYSAAAREARAIGVHMLCTLVIEPNRDPRMGRNEEGYSEDPFLCSQIAGAIVTGTQGLDISANDKVIAALCHYPGQSEPRSGLERGAMTISERTLREIFLPPWQAGITKHGALAVMATYPAIDGIAVHSSPEILTKLLREELLFQGIVLSEGRGITTIIEERVAATQSEAGALALAAGVDVGISFEDAWLGPMADNVRSGRVTMATLDRAVQRILRLKFMLGLFETPFVDPDRAVALVHSESHQELALQTAREGIVLLKNENNILPLKKNIQSVAVIGPNADVGIDQLGDYIPHNIPQDIVSVLQGIKGKVSQNTRVDYVKGCDIIGSDFENIREAQSAAERADVAIVVVGEAKHTNGEGKDVASLDLTGRQQDLVQAVFETGTPTVVVLINGRPLSIRWIAEHVPAIVIAWMCGEQGGNAVADVLFGDTNPSGRLPVTVPRHVGQLPVYYNYSATKSGKKYVDMSAEPLYEFGYGLSYTEFEYSGLQIHPREIAAGDSVQVLLDVSNTGERQGEEVVQLYINDEIASFSRPVKELKGFQKISLHPGETKQVKFWLRPEHLKLLDQNLEPVVEPGTFAVMVGSS